MLRPFNYRIASINKRKRLSYKQNNEGTAKLNHKTAAAMFTVILLISMLTFIVNLSLADAYASQNFNANQANRSEKDTNKGGIKTVEEIDLEKGEDLFGDELFQDISQNTTKEDSVVELKKNTQIRTISRNLDLIILCLAKKQSINGYYITLFIRRYFDIWLSAGAVYSTLAVLERKKFLKPAKKGKTKYYNLSKEGKEALDISHSTLNKLKHLLDISKDEVHE